MSETAAGGTGGLAATGAGQPTGRSGARSGAQPGGPATGNRPVALQLYTLRDELTGDRGGVLKRLAGFGYRTVEPYDVLTDPDVLRAELDAAGLSVCSVHTRPFGDDAEAAFRGARTVGAGTV